MRKAAWLLFCIVLSAGCATTRKWSDVQKDIAEVEATAGSNPVSAYLTYKEVLGSPLSCSREQRQTLANRMNELEPKAHKRIAADRQAAEREGDTRSSTLIGLIQALASTNVSPIMLEAQATVRPLSENSDSKAHTWSVSDVSASLIGKSFTDGNIRISAPSGSLVRVSACVSNISEQCDVPYMIWSFSSLKRDFGKWSIDDIADGRWLDNSHIDLSYDGGVAPCIYVCSGSKIPGGNMRLSNIVAHGSVIPFFQPAYIPKGQAATLDLLFVAPTDCTINELRVLGAKPASIPATAKK